MDICETVIVKGTDYLMLGSSLVVESIIDLESTKLLFGNYV